MNRLSIMFFVILIFLTGCSRKPEIPENPFRMKQVAIVKPEEDISLEISYHYDEIFIAYSSPFGYHTTHNGYLNSCQWKHECISLIVKAEQENVGCCLSA